jgi:hypothetical protein
MATYTIAPANGESLSTAATSSTQCAAYRGELTRVFQFDYATYDGTSFRFIQVGTDRVAKVEVGVEAATLTTLASVPVGGQVLVDGGGGHFILGTVTSVSSDEGGGISLPDDTPACTLDAGQTPNPTLTLIGNAENGATWFSSAGQQFTGGAVGQLSDELATPNTTVVAKSGDDWVLVRQQS